MMKKIEYDKQSNDNWFYYRFNEKNINTVSFCIIHFNLKIESEEYFIEQYIRLYKNLSQERDKIHFDERSLSFL